MKHLPAKASITPRLRAAALASLTTMFTLLGLALATAGLPAVMYAGGSAPSSTTVYAGGAGVFRSTDGGHTWAIIGSGFTGNVGSLAVDPTNPAVIYAGVYAGIYKTIDGGTTWTLMNNGLQQASFVTTIVIDPSTPSTVYAGTGIFAPGGVYKSTDSGATWIPDNGSGSTALMTNGILDVRALAIDPINTGTLYVTGVTGLTTSMTTNGGATWTPLTDSVGFGFAAAVNPIVTSTVYLAGPFGGSVSMNAGVSWTPLLTGLFVTSLAIDPTAPATVYAGTGECNQLTAACENMVYKTTNGGANFAAVGSLTSVPSNSTEQVNALAVDPASPSTLYAASGNGVYQSTNGGANWTLVYATASVSSLALVKAANSAPAGIIVGPGQSAAFPVVLPAPAGAGGVLVTLTSSDASNVALTAAGGSSTTVEILPGETTPRRPAYVYGVNFGSATVTATAPGFPSVTTNVLVTATLGFSPSSATVSLVRPTRLVLTLSAPAPPGGLTINLTSDNPAVASVPATVFLAANTTSVTLTLTPVSAGSTVIHASALPNVPDTDLSVTVIP